MRRDASQDGGPLRGLHNSEATTQPFSFDGEWGGLKH